MARQAGRRPAAAAATLAGEVVLLEQVTKRIKSCAGSRASRTLPVSTPARSYASTCQTVGMNLGYFTSFTVFLALNDASFSNKWLRRGHPPQEQGGPGQVWPWVGPSSECAAWLNWDQVRGGARRGGRMLRPAGWLAGWLAAFFASAAAWLGGPSDRFH